MTPHRIQLRRTKGWRKPEGAVVVARPSKWGNPYKVTPFEGGWSVDDYYEHHGVFEDERSARARAVELFEQYIQIFGLYEIPLDELAALHGRDLACWCPLMDEHGDHVPCHADVLLEVANR